MRPEPDDGAFIWDMLRYARGVIDSVSGMTFEDYAADENLRLATERRIEIIGEAARHVSCAFQNAYPQIPWQLIVAQRNVIAHEYGEIKHDRIWRVAMVHLPELLRLLEPLAPPPPPP